MKVYQSEHYEFHYNAGGMAEKDILLIANCQEESFRKIVETLKIFPSFKIKYYLCATAEEVGALYGDNEPCNGFAKEPDTIYAVYNEDIQCIGPHEDAHLISYLINVPNVGFIREGLAMYFDETWWGIPNDLWASYYKKIGEKISFSDLWRDEIFYETDCAISYPIAGSFTHYLIYKYGIEKYLQFYKEFVNDGYDILPTVFQSSMEEMEKDFLSFLDLVVLSEEVIKKMKELL